MRRVEDLLRDCAAKAGTTTGFGNGANRISHSDLEEKAERLAGSLQARDIMPGDRVVIFMDAGPPSLVAAFATFKAGAVVCPVSSSASVEQLTFVLNDTCATCLFADARLADVAAAAMAEAPLLRLVVVAGAEGAPAIEGLIRFEDAVLAEFRPLMPLGAEQEMAMLIYPDRAVGWPAPLGVTHDKIAAAGLDEIAGSLVNSAFLCVFAAAIAGMRPDRDALTDAA